MTANLNALSLAAPRNCVQKNGAKRRCLSRTDWPCSIIAPVRRGPPGPLDADPARSASSRFDRVRQCNSRQVSTLDARSAAPVAGQSDALLGIVQERLRQRV